MRQLETRPQTTTKLAALAVLVFFLQPGMAISADPPLEIDAARMVMIKRLMNWQENLVI